MIGGVTHHMLPHLSGVPHLYVNSIPGLMRHHGLYYLIIYIQLCITIYIF